MSTLVISDLHLGARSGTDRLREPAVLDALTARLEHADRLVVLGDLLELRESAMHEALDAARTVLERIGAALPPGAEVIVVPGNHDHRLLAPWLERRRREAAGPLGPEQLVEPAAVGEAAAVVAGWLGPAAVRFAYPGIWLRDDVYAMHGHYLDRHLTIPAFEPLSLRVIERLLRRRVAAMAPVEGYEAVIAPIYALIHELAQTAPPARGPASPRTAPHQPGPSARAYAVLARDGGGPRSLRDRVLAEVAFPAVVAGLNRAGLGPLRADITGPELRRASLRALRQAVRRLDVDADHVLFGHTHRSGPWPRDDATEWRADGQAELHNCGNWVREPFLGGADPQRSPYRAGTAVELGADGAPRLGDILG